MPITAPNFVQIGVVLPNLLTALDTQGNIWLIQAHPHIDMNPVKMSHPDWFPFLFCVKPSVVVFTSSQIAT